jgi:hypothetical protein
MWGDTALGGRVDGEYSSGRTAFDVTIHPTGAFVDGSFEHLSSPPVQERGMESGSGGVTVGKHKGLLGVQRLPRERVEAGSVPVNFDLDLGNGDWVCRICALSIGCEGDVGSVVMGIEILRDDRYR